MMKTLCKRNIPRTLALCALIFSLGSVAWGHNQNPAAIRKAMDKAFQSVGATVPGNVLKGNRTLRIAGTNAQVFDVKKDGTLVASIAQLEIQEQVAVVAIDLANKKVASVIKDGRAVEAAEWPELSFVEETLKALSK